MKPIRQWKCLHPVSIIYLKPSTQLIDKCKVSIFYRDWLHIWRLSSGSLLPNDLNVRFCIISNGAVISVDLTIDLNGLSDSGKEALSSARASAFRDVLIVSRFWDNMLRHNPVVALYGIDATLLLRPQESLINVKFNSFRGDIVPLVSMRKKHIQMSINGLVALKYTLRPVVTPNFLGKFGNGSLSIWQRITSTRVLSTIKLILCASLLLPVAQFFEWNYS